MLEGEEWKTTAATAAVGRATPPLSTSRNGMGYEPRGPPPPLPLPLPPVLPGCRFRSLPPHTRSRRRIPIPARGTLPSPLRAALRRVAMRLPLPTPGGGWRVLLDCCRYFFWYRKRRKPFEEGRRKRKKMRAGEGSEWGWTPPAGASLDRCFGNGRIKSRVG